MHFFSRFLSLSGTIFVVFSGNVAGQAADIPPPVIAVCAPCHGKLGESTAPTYPRLAGQDGAYLLKQLFDIRTGKRKSEVMAGVLANINARESEQAAEFFSRQRPARPGSIDTGRASVGRALYLQGREGISACASCHGPQGRGGYMLPRLAGQNPEYLSHRLRQFLHSPGADVTGMHSSVRGLSESEILSVSHFAASFD